MAKTNCWEAKQCGRQPGGAKTGELGVCPCATKTAADGIHGGRNAGRACWAVAGTLCGGQIQGSFAQKMANCLKCDFYQTVRREEGSNLLSAPDIVGRLH